MSVTNINDGEYTWSEWPDGDDSSLAMSHTGIVLARGHIVMGAASEASLVFRDAGGNVEQVVPVSDAAELHGLTLVAEDGEDLLWIADPGFKAYGGKADFDLQESPRGGQVFQVDLDGRRRRTIEQPDLDAYAEAGWQPTGVAVDETRLGGSGDIWVTDGYGASLVHRYTDDGRHVATLSGDEGAGRFDQPHDLLIDRRGSTPELLVADRINGRIQVYDLDGRFRRVIGAGVLPGPTQMAIDGDRLVVTDLLAGRVTVLDATGNLVSHLFALLTPPAGWDATPDEWPLARADDGTLTRASLEPGVFHTPHGVAVDAHGTIYVSEFAIGGRIAVLTPRAR
jgi:DNA-binding beta-propeller fold protein YncE